MEGVARDEVADRREGACGDIQGCEQMLGVRMCCTRVIPLSLSLRCPETPRACLIPCRAGVLSFVAMPISEPSREQRTIRQRPDATGYSWHFGDGSTDRELTLT